MRYVGMRNMVTGQSWVADNYLKRVERMKTRVRMWAGFLSGSAHLLMITLTYDTKKTKNKMGKDWEVRDITEFIRRLRRYLERRGVKILAYAWVAELQPSGHVHYHLLVRLSKLVYRLYVDELGLWRWGDTSIGKAHGVGYIVKYATKGEAEDLEGFPKGLRLFAVWTGDINQADALRVLCTAPWVLRARASGICEADIKEFGRPRSEWAYVCCGSTREFVEFMLSP
jgi:hypothetical protein